MMKRTYLVVAILVFFASSPLFADTGRVAGYITDRLTGKQLAGVTLRVENTRLGAITNTKGHFEITGVPIGDVVLSATSVGYESEKVKTILRSDGSREIVFTMMPSDINSSPIIVSAGRRVQAVQDVPISVATLGQQDLVKRGITQLDDALRYVSGVNVVGDQVNIRGASGFAFGLGSRTMVLLDGFPLLSGDNGDIKFDVLPVGDVNRIEIIKGAGSALYGTGALGGVVSMFTKPATPELDVNVRLYGGLYTPLRFDDWQNYRPGTPTQWGGDARISQKIGDFSYNLSGGIRQDQSYRDFDKKIRGFGFGKFQWTPSDMSTVTLSTLYALQDSENFIYWKNLANATLPPDLQDRSERLVSEKLAVAVEWMELLSNKTSLVIRPSVFSTHFENRINGIALDSNTSTSNAVNLDVMLTSTLTDNLTITGGATGRANIVNADVYGSQVQTILSGFAQAEITLPMRVILTAGVRVDREETRTLDPQLEFSPKLGASWRATDALTLRASTGRGFRAATIAERYANIRYGPFRVRPNPDIRPEYSWSTEIGGRLEVRDWLVPIEIDLAVFDNELFDLIEPTFDLDDPEVPIFFRNVTRARIIGTEVTVRTALGRGVGLETGLTAMVPRDLTLNETLKYRNSLLWYTRGSWSFVAGPLDLEVQAEYRYQSKVESIDERLNLFVPNADQRVPGHIVDARIFWNAERALNAPLRFGILAKNVLDYYYAEVVANLSPTRSILFQVEWR